MYMYGVFIHGDCSHKLLASLSLFCFCLLWKSHFIIPPVQHEQTASLSYSRKPLLVVARGEEDGDRQNRERGLVDHRDIMYSIGI